MFRCLDGNGYLKECDKFNIRSPNLEMYLQRVQKSALSPFDERTCFECKIEIKPWYWKSKFWKVTRFVYWHFILIISKRWTQFRRLELSIPISYTIKNIRGYVVGRKKWKTNILSVEKGKENFSEIFINWGKEVFMNILLVERKKKIVRIFYHLIQVPPAKKNSLKTRLRQSFHWQCNLQCNFQCNFQFNFQRSFQCNFQCKFTNYHFCWAITKKS